MTAVSVKAGNNTSVGGKRKQVAKNWGKDQECYGEVCLVNSPHTLTPESDGL